jgi:hypothetical protein
MALTLSSGRDLRGAEGVFSTAPARHICCFIGSKTWLVTAKKIWEKLVTVGSSAVKVPLVQTAVLIQRSFSAAMFFAKQFSVALGSYESFWKNRPTRLERGRNYFLQDANAKARPNGRRLACILQGRLGRCLPERRAGVRLSGFREE